MRKEEVENQLRKSPVFKTDDMDESHSAETAEEGQIGTMSLIKCYYHKMGYFFLIYTVYSKYAITVSPIFGEKKQISIPDYNWDLKSSVSIVSLSCCS